MELISFRLSGRFAHFLRAETSASALSYPVPPRTTILGILGAVLGLSKDKPQIDLEPASIAIAGRFPKTHWHRAKFRKDPPVPLSYTIKKTQKVDINTRPEKATLILQEWLFNPTYVVWISIPKPHYIELKSRLSEKQWHFTPSLGLSEMMVDIEYLGSLECSSLPEGTYDVQSVFQKKKGTVDVEQIFERELSVQLLRMPRSVTPERIFSHSVYIAERESKPIPVKTDQAYRVDNKILMFL